MTLLQLGIQWPEAFVFMATVAGALITGALYVANNRSKKNGNGGVRYSADRTPMGETPTSMWLQQFSGMQRGQNYILAVLVGQGVAFLMFALSMRQDFSQRTAQTDSRLDTLVSEVGGMGTQLRSQINEIDDGAIHALNELKEMIGKMIK